MRSLHHTAKRRDWSGQAQTLLSHLVDQDGTDMRRLGEYLSLHEAGQGDRWTWLARRLVQDELIQESNDGLQRLYVRDSGAAMSMTPGPSITPPEIRPWPDSDPSRDLFQTSFWGRTTVSSCHLRPWH